MDYDRLLANINRGLQAFFEDNIRLPEREELPPLAVPRDFTWRTEDLEPTPAMYVGTEEQLRVRVWTSLASCPLRVRGRYITARGDLIAFDERVTVTSPQIAADVLFPLPAGAFLTLTVTVDANNLAPGSVYVRAAIARTGDRENIDVAVLCQGYVASQSPLFYPGYASHPVTSGPGTVRTITGLTPGPGANMAENIPLAVQWELLSLRVALVTSATVATRRMVLAFSPQGTETWRQQALVTQAASTGVTYMFAQGYVTNSEGVTNVHQYSIPKMFFTTGGSFSSFVLNLQAGDQVQDVVYSVREWMLPEGA